MNWLRFAKQLLGWFLFAEACSWILNYIGITLKMRFDGSLDWVHLIAGHVVLGLTALCFWLWYRWVVLRP